MLKYCEKEVLQMKEEILNKKRAIASTKIFPWFIGFSDDLMFYIAINTLFLTVVKNLTTSQITFLTTLSSLCYIILQKPCLYIIKKIGNTYSVRIGVMLLLTGAVLLTFGNSYSMLMIAHVIYTVSFIFKSMSNVMLKNNLNYLKLGDSFIKIENKAHIIYSTITFLFAMFAGYIFNINHYLPMYLCITVCIINVIMSMKLYDVREEDVTNKKQESVNTPIKSKLPFMIFLTIISYGILYSTISIGQQNVKLFIQYQLQNDFTVTLTATYLGYIVAFSRIARLLGNIGFKRLYARYQDQLNLLLPIICGIAFCLVILATFISSIMIKYIVMTVGFCLVLAIRDVVTTYIQDLLLKKAKVYEQQRAISYLGLSRKIGETCFSFLFFLMLLHIDLFYVVVVLVGFSIISLGVNKKLYQMVIKDEKEVYYEKEKEKEKIIYEN